MRRVVTTVLAGLGMWATLAAPAHAAPELYTLDPAALETARARVEAGDPALRPAFEALVAIADKRLAAPAEAVTLKTLTPASGDKHDYMSIAPYWWPDPAKPDGLPYIRKDGNTNPSSKNDDTDSVRIQRMCDRVRDLALAYHFTRRADYARAAGEQIRAWFLTPATRMNPNLRFGQAVPGVVDGRGIGLIDTRNFWAVIDAVGLIAPAAVLTDDETRALKSWFGAFADWMRTSPEGREEYTWHNNHGAYFDAQIADYELFAGDVDAARRTVTEAIHVRMASHFAIDGKQYAELERTQPYHYSAFNLDAHLRLARYGELTGVDYWNAVQDGRSMRAGINFLLPYLKDPKSWPFQDLKGVTFDMMLPVVLRAARQWPDGAYASYLETMPKTLASDQSRLLWPTR